MTPRFPEGGRPKLPRRYVWRFSPPIPYGHWAIGCATWAACAAAGAAFGLHLMGVI